MSEDYKNNQIIRKDAKNCFVESLNGSFSIGKAHLGFASYDMNKPAGSRKTNRINIYISVEELLLMTKTHYETWLSAYYAAAFKPQSNSKPRQTAESPQSFDSII